MRPLQNVVDQGLNRQLKAIEQEAQRERRNTIAVVIILLSITCVVTGATFAWGWPVGLFTVGLCLLPVGILLGMSNEK